MNMDTYARSLDLSGPDGAFTVACALYWYCSEYHEGQGSDLYRILSQLQYRPGCLETGPEADSTDDIVYADLVNGTVDPADALVWIHGQMRD